MFERHARKMTAMASILASMTASTVLGGNASAEQGCVDAGRLVDFVALENGTINGYQQYGTIEVWYSRTCDSAWAVLTTNKAAGTQPAKYDRTIIRGEAVIYSAKNDAQARKHKNNDRCSLKPGEKSCRTPSITKPQLSGYAQGNVTITHPNNSTIEKYQGIVDFDPTWPPQAAGNE